MYDAQGPLTLDGAKESLSVALRLVVCASMREQADIAVLGGGIIGLSIAWELGLQGHSVALWDRDEPASHASARAGGILVSRAVTDSQVPGRMFYTRSIAAWPEWLERIANASGMPLSLTRGGDWALFAHSGRAEAFADRLRRESDALRWQEQEHLPAQLRGLVADRPWRVFHFPDEACLDPVPVLAGLQVAAARAGVRLDYGLQGVSVTRDGEGFCLEASGRRLHCATLVMAAGPWSGQILSGLGWQARTQAVRGQIALVPALHPMDCMVHLEDQFYAVPRNGFTLLGATSEVGQWEEETTKEGLAWLQERIRKVFPGVDLSGAHRVWAGIRPRTLDRVPHLGWLEPGSLAVASGHYRSGISMAPLTGEVVGDLFRGISPGEDLRGLDPLRPKAGYERRD